MSGRPIRDRPARREPSDDAEARRRAALAVRRNMIIMNLAATVLIILVTIIAVQVAGRWHPSPEPAPAGQTTSGGAR
ncbi:hypothetical protein [Microlunatus sp. GCM10028923]|uniref:hypothetical protein n=1 Tax=Microlunatus sp. GCM10028923 TaxID=3273400 RepID=UPI00360D28E0